MNAICRTGHVLAFALAAVVAIVVFLPLTLVFGAVGEFFRFRSAGAWTHTVAGYCVRLGFRMVPGWRIGIEGAELLPQGRTPVVIVANHRSLFDILLLYQLRLNFRFLGKRENFRIPGFGCVGHLARYIPIERSSKEDRWRSLEKCVQAVRGGSSVCIFPEGTRSSTTELLPFRDGAFRVAQQCGVPVLPIVLLGTREMLGARSGLPVPGAVTVRVLPLESGEAHASPAEFAAHVRSRIERAI